MSSLELIKIVIQSIEKKLRKDDFKNKAQEKIQSILHSYGLQSQTYTLSEKITKIFFKGMDYENLKNAVMDELKIADTLTHDGKEISNITDKIIREVAFKVDPSLWDEYYMLKTAEEKNKISNELKGSLSNIKYDTQKIIDMLCDNICSLDEYESELAKKYDNSKVRINYDFFNYNDLEFRSRLKETLKTSQKYIYVQGVSQEDALYATLFELSIMPIKNDVLVVKNPENFERSELSALKNKIYVIAYPTAEKEIVPLYNGRLIIPYAKNELLQGANEEETLYVSAREKINFYESLREAGYENYSEYVEKYGSSLTTFNQHFLKTGKGTNKIRFLDNLKEITQLKRLILLGEFLFYPERDQIKTDFDYITKYAEIQSREKLEKILRKYSAPEYKLFDVSYTANSQNNKRADINKVKIPKGNYWDIVFNDIEQSEIDKFYNFSLFIIKEYLDTRPKSFYQGYNGPSRELISEIFNSWIYISDCNYSKKELANRFLTDIMDNPQYEYFIIPYALQLARINPSIFLAKCHNRIEKLKYAEIKKIRVWWYSGFSSAFTYLADYFDKEKTIDFLMDEFLPICVEKNLEFLLSNFLHEELNPYQEDVLYNEKEFKCFLNRYPENTIIYDAIFEYLPRYGERGWDLKTSHYFPVGQPLYNKIKAEEKAKILHHTVDYVYQYASNNADRIRQVLSYTAAIEYGYSFTQIGKLLSKFNSFNDESKVKIELALREKKKRLLAFSTPLEDRIEWLNSFLNSIKYQDEKNKYLWLFHKNDLDFAPIYDDLKITEIYDSPALRGETIIKHLDSNFSLSTVLELMKSGKVEDMEAMTYVGIEYSGNKYNSEFFSELIKVTPNAYLYLDILLSKGNDKSCIFRALNDLENNKEAKYFHNNYATILSYVPYKEAKPYLMRTEEPAVDHRYYEIASRGTIGNKHLTKAELEDVLKHLFKEGDGANILFLLCFNGDYFSEEELVSYLEKVMRSIDKSKCFNGDLLDKEFDRIRKFYWNKLESHDLIKDLEFWFLGIDVIKEDSIFLLFIDEHPEFVGNMLKATKNKENYGILTSGAIEDVFTYMKEFKLSDYCKWIDTLEAMAQKENFMDYYLLYIPDLFTVAPTEEGFSFVPVESAAQALEAHNELRYCFGTAIFNRNNLHAVDGGFFLKNKGNILKNEASRIKDVYPALSKELNRAANMFFDAAEKEKYRDRYE